MEGKSQGENCSSDWSCQALIYSKFQPGCQGRLHSPACLTRLREMQTRHPGGWDTRSCQMHALPLLSVHRERFSWFPATLCCKQLTDRPWGTFPEVKPTDTRKRRAFPTEDTTNQSQRSPEANTQAVSIKDWAAGLCSLLKATSRYLSCTKNTVRWKIPTPNLSHKHTLESSVPQI